MRTWIVALILSVTLVACTKPSPPTIRPERAEFLNAGPGAVMVRVHCQAHNPNKIPLPVRSVDAKLSLAGNPLGNVTGSSLATLAPETDTPAAFDLTVPWSNLAPALTAAGGGDEVPYTVEGTAWFEAAGLKFGSSFKTDAKLKKSELIGAALRSLPGLPGLLPR
jgi:hypothetical protein